LLNPKPKLLHPQIISNSLPSTSQLNSSAVNNVINSSNSENIISFAKNTSPLSQQEDEKSNSRILLDTTTSSLPSKNKKNTVDFDVQFNKFSDSSSSKEKKVGFDLPDPGGRQQFATFKPNRIFKPVLTIEKKEGIYLSLFCVYVCWCY
jgi:hypothetical protein